MDFDDREEAAFWQPEDGDWLLTKMVTLVNAEGGAMDVTLTVGGSLITGEMIGGTEYFELVGRAFADSQGRFSEFGARLYSSSDIDPTPAFLHMKNAVILCGNRAVPPHGNGMLWRGRIAAVDGFAWGRTAPDTE